jgi:23S rRNA (cytosine1962-C5)-methyltransferase
MNLITTPEPDYELLDSGNGKKLERYEQWILSRPDPQALWRPTLDREAWSSAHGIFMRDGKTTKWKLDKTMPSSWPISFGGLMFEIRPTTFKHTGLFPEHRENWNWMREILTRFADANHPLHYRGEGSKQTDRKSKNLESGDVKVLNLFGYTGGASLACAQAGADVVHIDGSKLAIAWGKKNQELSGLQDKKIRWILDDALLFLKREVKRGNTYHGIVMDPPAFGRGPKGEIWKIEEQWNELIELCLKVLDPNPLFFLINGYASGYSPIAYKNSLMELVQKHGGIIETGELTIAESTTDRLLPCGIFARWSKTN